MPGKLDTRGHSLLFLNLELRGSAVGWIRPGGTAADVSHILPLQHWLWAVTGAEVWGRDGWKMHFHWILNCSYFPKIIGVLTLERKEDCADRSSYQNLRNFRHLLITDYKDQKNTFLHNGLENIWTSQMRQQYQYVLTKVFLHQMHVTSTAFFVSWDIFV